MEDGSQQRTILAPGSCKSCTAVSTLLSDVASASQQGTRKQAAGCHTSSGMQHSCNCNGIETMPSTSEALRRSQAMPLMTSSALQTSHIGTSSANGILGSERWHAKLTTDISCFTDATRDSHEVEVHHGLTFVACCKNKAYSRPTKLCPS